MNSSAGASYYLSDSKWTDTWYAELEGDQSKLERRGLRDIIIRPETALLAASAPPEDCRYPQLLLPNFINLPIAAGTEGQDEENQRPARRRFYHGISPRYKDATRIFSGAGSSMITMLASKRATSTFPGLWR